MILLDKPYVSPFLKQTIVENQLPVLKSDGLDQFALAKDTLIWEEEAALRRFSDNGPGRLYSNSENALGWMMRNLAFSDIPRRINLLKDKKLFRDLLQPLYPGFYYQEISLKDLQCLELQAVPMPLIVKPSVGFFSMGVNKVTSKSDWPHVVAAIHAEMEAVHDLYPHQVLDTTRFILESYVAGEEFAIDAYYDQAGNVVLINILLHLFSSAEDVSDRVYITSREIIEKYRSRFTSFLTDIGQKADLRNFPVHAEVRIDAEGRIAPIEINPMRFAGWCTTDIAHYAYGINPYTSYLDQMAPDWDQILTSEDDHLYSIVVMDKPGDVMSETIAHFDYEKVCSQFEMPLELRKINYKEYPVFGFMFTKTRKENIVELERILRSDLREFIS
jgi:hypothetical protein